MPETRNTEVFDYPEGMKAADKILANAEITLEPYEVSDEELGRETAERVITELSDLADEDLKVPQVGKFLKALARLRR